MFFEKDEQPEWLDGTFGDVCKGYLELFVSRLVWICGIVVVLLFFVSEHPGSQYDWTANKIFSEVVILVAFVAFFEVVVRRYYHKVGDGPEAEGVRAVLANKKQEKEEKNDG